MDSAFALLDHAGIIHEQKSESRKVIWFLSSKYEYIHCHKRRGMVKENEEEEKLRLCWKQCRRVTKSYLSLSYERIIQLWLTYETLSITINMLTKLIRHTGSTLSHHIMSLNICSLYVALFSKLSISFKYQFTNIFQLKWVDAKC